MCLPALEELDVSDNALTHIDLRLFDRIIAPKLRSFNGQDNILQHPPQELVDQCWTVGDEKKQVEGVQCLELYASQETAKGQECAVIIDRQLLFDIFGLCGGVGWKNKGHWGSDNTLDKWYGVKCDSEERVLALRLPFNKLQGAKCIPSPYLRAISHC
jgi:hypothetical protein